MTPGRAPDSAAGRGQCIGLEGMHSWDALDSSKLNDGLEGPLMTGHLRIGRPFLTLEEAIIAVAGEKRDTPMRSVIVTTRATAGAIIARDDVMILLIFAIDCLDRVSIRYSCARGTRIYRRGEMR